MRGEKAVIDASAIAALLIPEKYTRWARETVERYEALYTTSLAPYEVYNVVWKKHLRGEIGGDALPLVEEVVEEFLETLVVRDLSGDVRREALGIAVKHGLTFYDAAYLALALRLDAALVTCDVRLGEKLPAPLRARVVFPGERKMK